MWQAIISLLGGPVVRGLLDAYQAKLKAGTTDARIAADLAAAEVAEQTKVKIAEVGNPFEPEKLAFYVTLIFYAKCVIYDKVLALGSTDPLAGDVSTWAGLIMGFYFGKQTFENIARILKK